MTPGALPDRDGWRLLSSDALGVALEVPAGLHAQSPSPDRLVLIRPTSDPAEFETLRLSRHRERGGDTADGWQHALARMVAEGQWHNILLAPLQPYPLGEYDGTLGLLRFTDGWGASMVAALWTGQVGRETVTLLYRCGVAREDAFSATVGRLLDTLTVAPRRRVGNAGGRGRAGEAPPAVVFGVNVAIAVALIILGVLLQTR